MAEFQKKVDKYGKLWEISFIKIDEKIREMKTGHVLCRA